jgi:hypothetical protein
MSFILVTTERALANLIASSLEESVNVTIYGGMDNEEKTAPACIISAEEATEEFPNSGVWHVKTNIIVKEIAADTVKDNSIAGTIFEALLSNDTKDKLNLNSDYYVYDIITEDTLNSQEQDAWIQTLRLDVICALK